MIRKFTILPEPSVADPAHFVLCREETEKDGKPEFIQYSDFTQLKSLIQDVELKDAQRAGFSLGIEYVLKLFGITREEFQEKLKASKNPT